MIGPSVNPVSQGRLSLRKLTREMSPRECDVLRATGNPLDTALLTAGEMDPTGTDLDSAERLRFSIERREAVIEKKKLSRKIEYEKLCSWYRSDGP